MIFLKQRLLMERVVPAVERILNRTIAVRREVTKPQTFSRLILQSKGRGKYAIMRTLTVITLWLTVWPILPQNGGETSLKIEEQGSERKKNYVFRLCIKCKLVRACFLSGLSRLNIQTCKTYSVYLA